VVRRAGSEPKVSAPVRAVRLVLSEFRSYSALALEVGAGLVALCGENGAGKTNLLEALSLLTPGRGLRRAELAQMIREGAASGFAVSVDLEGPFGEVRLGVGAERPALDEPLQRRALIDRAPVSSVAAFAEHVRVVWLTPDLDGLFRGAAGERRRFLDRLVLAVDPGHAARTSALERALRSRNRLLEDERPDPAWLDAIEREIVETGVAVASARRETVDRLSALIAAGRDDASPFPFARLTLKGEIDDLVAALPALEAEERYKVLLREGRGRDRAAGRTLTGPQASDLEVWHGPKDMPAAQGSTGEQKALLVGLVLAHARLVATMSGLAPLVLLDEIAAHLDPRRRAALYDTLAGLGCQVWMSGADAALFDDLPAGAALLAVTPGRVARAR
jgi:DNA replication and repair protein RecF